MHAHHDGDESRNARESRNAALTGFAVAIVWLAVVTFVSYQAVFWLGGSAAAH